MAVTPDANLNFGSVTVNNMLVVVQVGSSSYVHTEQLVKRFRQQRVCSINDRFPNVNAVLFIIDLAAPSGLFGSKTLFRIRSSYETRHFNMVWVAEKFESYKLMYVYVLANDAII